jgi:DnaJ-class molecular chaperone
LKTAEQILEVHVAKMREEQQGNRYADVAAMKLLPEWKTTIAVMEEYKNQSPSTVPYQTCPLCNGSGIELPTGLSTATSFPCSVCKGAKVIPQYQQPELPEGLYDLLKEVQDYMKHRKAFTFKAEVEKETDFVNRIDNYLK